MGDFKLYYRIGMAAEKNILLDEYIKDTYHGVVVGANVAAYGKTWVSQFLKTLSKPFFIDPQTHAFQTSRDFILKNDGMKKSYSTLALEYGIERIVLDGKRELVPEDFDVREDLIKFVKSTMEFQRKLISPVTGSQKSIFEYAEILGYDEEISKVEEPEFLIAPYFYFRNTEDPWYNVNLHLMDCAKELFSESEVYVVICTEKDVLLEKKEIDIIVDHYSDINGIILWFSDFNELNQEKEILKSYIRFLRKLSSKDIIAMYGGHFSILSSKFGLNGISPGIGMSEYKNVTHRVTGGVFSNRYYIPQAKTMVVEADARSFYLDHPADLCKCNVCGEITKNASSDPNEFFTQLTPELAKKHYCLCKAAENRYIQERPLSEITENLKGDFNFCEENIDGIYNIKYRHLEVWLSVLEDVVASQVK